MELLCIHCGVTYSRRGAAGARSKFCSKPCRIEWERVNPRNDTEKYRRKDALPTVRLSCVHCSVRFSAIGSKSEKKFCSKDCADKGKTLPTPTFNCEVCGKLTERKKKNGRGYSYAVRFCSKDCANQARRTGSTDKNGYIIHNRNGKSCMEHRLVMSEHLGRELQEHENVHHKNGMRDDNKIENLELWSTKQPKGQRVEDKIAWCIEFLREYGYFVSGGPSDKI